MISVTKRKVLLLLATSLYLIFLVVIYKGEVVQNNTMQKINADAYFYTEMSEGYFQATSKAHP